MKQPTFQYHPGTFGMSKAQELWIVFPESCHSCNFRPVIGFPGFLPHIEHKDLEVVRGRLISSKPFSVTKHDFLLDQSRAPRAEVHRAAHGHHRSPKHQARLGQPGSPRTATAPPASRPAGTAPEAAGTRTSKRSVPAMGWQSRGSWQGHAAVRPSSCRRPSSNSSPAQPGHPMSDPAATSASAGGAGGRGGPGLAAPPVRSGPGRRLLMRAVRVQKEVTSTGVILKSSVLLKDETGLRESTVTAKSSK